jgi:uncharacterized Zn-finger protein
MSFINETILLFINVLHIIVILFVLCAPFSGSNYFLSMHIMIVPFILLHWVLNNNTCSLTVAEKFIREKTYGKQVNENECYSFKFIAPIYDFNKNHEAYSSFTYGLTISLWLVSVFNMSTKIYDGKIKKFQDLCVL